MNLSDARLELTARWEDQTQYWRNFVTVVIQTHKLRGTQPSLIWKAIDLHLAEYSLVCETDGVRSIIVGSEEDFLAWVLAYA